MRCCPTDTQWYNGTNGPFTLAIFAAISSAVSPVAHTVDFKSPRNDAWNRSKNRQCKRAIRAPLSPCKQVLRHAIYIIFIFSIPLNVQIKLLLSSVLLLLVFFLQGLYIYLFIYLKGREAWVQGNTESRKSEGEEGGVIDGLLKRVQHFYQSRTDWPTLDKILPQDTTAFQRENSASCLAQRRQKINK